MQTKYKFPFGILFYGFVLLLAVSCTEDPEYVKPLPDVEINLGEIKDLYYYNEVLSLSPTITSGNQSEEDFTYHWSLINGDNSIDLSNEHDLSITLNTLGAHILYYEVTNNKTSLTSYATATIMVESVTNQGWYVLKETQNGNTDLDGFYPGVDLPEYNVIEKWLGAPLAGEPKGLVFSPSYKWKPDSASQYSSTACIIPFSEDGGMVYNVNTALPLATLNDMFFLQPDQANRKISSVMGNSDKILLSMGQRAYSMNSGNPAFFPGIEGDYELSKYYTVGSFGNTLAFDKKNKSFVMFSEAGYGTSDTIGYFKDVYGEFNNGVEISVTHMNGDVVFLENTVSGSGYSSVVYAYALFQEEGEQNDLSLLGLDYDTFVKGLYYYYPTPGDWSDYTVVVAGEYNPINFQRSLPASTYGELTSARHYVMNKTTPILYFEKDNKIGLYNISTEAYNPSFITDIPTGEEVTFMKYINCSYLPSDPDFQGLVVATYQSANNTYHIYRYKLEGLSTVSREEVVLSGTGKVNKVMYVSASSYEWQMDLYKYN
ncbi:PKD-like family lipoprotein [uncultured Sunxiuqinia sp.]|uniref:PKD-like family lipoprotein n=1 Tax=uncultured Sunxiuqinia sp. TaxID=1573825 RepID=UPI002AA8B306|nr:PKD-like family lipoprotein [uncultured Sunxiuqinia sp.]